jgi:hypothetical protein
MLHENPKGSRNPDLCAMVSIQVRIIKHTSFLQHGSLVNAKEWRILGCTQTNMDSKLGHHIFGALREQIHLDLARIWLIFGVRVGHLQSSSWSSSFFGAGWIIAMAWDSLLVQRERRRRNGKPQACWCQTLSLPNGHDEERRADQKTILYKNTHMRTNTCRNPDTL